MRIVIHYNDDTRQTYDTSFLVFANNCIEFVSQDVSYFVDLSDVFSFHIAEDLNF